MWNGTAFVNGTIYQLDPPAVAAGTWSETVLYLFSDPVIESQPGAMLTAGSNTLLGVTGYGGALFEGTVYELTY